MAIVKEVKNSIFGIVRIGLTYEKEMVYCLQDLCKLLGLNMQNMIVSLGNDKVKYLEFTLNKNKTKKAFIDKEGLKFCVWSSKDPKADYIGLWLTDMEENHTTLFMQLKPQDLKDVNIAEQVLKRLNELEKLVSVLKYKVEEDAEKIEFVDSIYGSKVPIDLSLVPRRLKFRNINHNTILEDLRTAGIFNERNQPVQKYIDEGYFRFVSVTTMIGSTERVSTKTLVYNKGLKLIEKIIKKKVGSSEKNRKNIHR